MEVVARVAKQQGYAPDVMVCAGDTPAGRPGPFMALKALVELSISPVEAVVKIGDTVVDVEEGLNGGMWTIGLSASGNEVGLTAAQYAALPGRRARAVDRGGGRQARARRGALRREPAGRYPARDRGHRGAAGARREAVSEDFREYFRSRPALRPGSPCGLSRRLNARGVADGKYMPLRRQSRRGIPPPTTSARERRIRSRFRHTSRPSPSCHALARCARPFQTCR